MNSSKARRIFLAAVISSVLGLTFSWAMQPNSDSPALTRAITDKVTFFYYKDLEAPERFYRDVIGLKQTIDLEYVKMFRITEHALVGLVREGDGYHKVAEQRPVMLSFVTADLEEWYAYIRQFKDIPILREYIPGATRSKIAEGFLILDPGGYTVEFFRWKEDGVAPGGIQRQ